MIVVKNPFGGSDPAEILNSSSATAGRIGSRIREIRTARGLSQKDLGKMVGLSADRVQQYENGRRKPKLPLLKKFAYALGVNTIALMDPVPDSYVGAMHALFQMEEKLDMKIVKKDGCYCLQFGDGKHDGMNNYLKDWYEIRKALDEAMPNLTDEERKKKVFDYNMFEWTYPSGLAINAHRKYDEHPINRMQEIREDNEHYADLMEGLEKKAQDDNS